MPLRVIYKKVGQEAEERILKNEYKLKKYVVEGKLDIIPYDNIFILCPKQGTHLKVNVFFDLFHVSGDLIVINIDREKKDFKSLSKSQIDWYIPVLNHKQAREIEMPINIAKLKEARKKQPHS